MDSGPSGRTGTGRRRRRANTVRERSSSSGETRRCSGTRGTGFRRSALALDSATTCHYPRSRRRVSSSVRHPSTERGVLGASSRKYRTPLARCVRRPTLWLLLLGAAWLGARVHHYSPWMDDDAYISCRYAHNLATGRGLVFNAGERVEGYTNFLWTVTLAALSRLGVEPPTAARALGVLFSFLALPLLLCFDFVPDPPPGARAASLPGARASSGGSIP